MDNCSIESYLHKKFKKQSTTVTVQQNAVPSNSERTSPPVSAKQTVEASSDHRNVPQLQGQRPLYTDKTLTDSDVPTNFSTNSSSDGSHATLSPHVSSISVSSMLEPRTGRPVQYLTSSNSVISLQRVLEINQANQVSAISEPSILNLNRDSKLQSRSSNLRDEAETFSLSDKIEISSIPEKPGGKYVCHYCNLVCSKPSVLQKHIRAHTNERPFPCVSCGFSFKTRSNLYKHCRSRTHANRVLGNKAQEISVDMDDDKQEPMKTDFEEIKQLSVDTKSKPYKPRFKAFFDSSGVTENGDIEPSTSSMEPPKTSTTNVDLISLHIDEIIHKNNSIIVNTNDPTMYKKRNAIESHTPEVVTNNNHHEYSYNKYHEFYQSQPPVHINQIHQQMEVQVNDEPLNLTNKNRKRCVSEVQEPIVQKSLIKELLLKNLYADANKQCPHCKMIFQTVTELDLHKLRSCKGYQKAGARYSRSSSVNVASILTQNKNAFDTNPHIPSTVFPLKSPGPFLGKTRLVESDKAKSFSFDDGIQTTTFQSSYQSSQDLLRMSQRYSLSPLTLQNEQYRKQPVKLFGGEVKIQNAEKPYEAKNNEKYQHRNYIEYANNLSENTVVKSTLQSGGTIVQTKQPYEEVKVTSPEIIRVYESPPISPTIDVVNVDKPTFTYRPEVIVDYSQQQTEETPYTYMNIMDYSQNAVKMLTPKIKQPTLNLQEMIAPLKVNVAPKSTPFDPKIDMPVFPKDLEEKRKSENIDFAQKQILLQQKMTLEPPKLQVPYNPVKFLVNGKVIRYVPGMPGPITVDTPLDATYSPSSPIAPAPRPNIRLTKPNIRITPPESVEKYQDKPPCIIDRTTLTQSMDINRSPKMAALEINTDLNPKVSEIKSPIKTGVIDAKSPKLPENRSPIKSPNPPTCLENPKKFARPNSLAIKSMIPGSLKQHHGLTPTMFNQILISPDTPRVAKKYNHQILHGNYFSYLGLKSSTKSSYCTLNKTQPFYVPHFKKLSMYSEWRQHTGTKMEKLYAGAYDSRQRNCKYTVAKSAMDDTILHSTYKFTVIEQPSLKEDSNKGILGGFESNEDYTYIRGRGRGRYVCDQCGIRCKKPSMLKKHIRTHSNDRPYTCNHCNFSGGVMCLSSFCSFKTKGNLTKHMKSKAHTKNYAACSTASGNASVSPTLQSGTPSSDSESDDSILDSSDESSTRNQEQQEREAVFGLLSLSQKPTVTEGARSSPNGTIARSIPVDSPNFMDTERIAHVTKTNYAKNKILDQSINFNAPKIPEIPISNADMEFRENQKMTKYLGKTNTTRPLTYPYTTPIVEVLPSESSMEMDAKVAEHLNSPKIVDPKQFSVISRYTKSDSNHTDEEMPQNVASDLRKRKLSVESSFSPKISRTEAEVIDLSMPSINGRKMDHIPNGYHPMEVPEQNIWKAKEIVNNIIRSCEQPENSPKAYESDDRSSNDDSHQYSMSYIIAEKTPNKYKPVEYDNSAMETLADIATKQEKLEKNSVAKNVASEFLKLATKNEQNESLREAFISNSKEVIVKPEENKNCNICMKTFSKPSQLRLHMNIHYLERPFRCDSCSVSFRTKGHLQKHERSASHHNKLSSSPNLSSSEPRPFKCSDCNIAFRIHGHLAKHLRAKMHIMKLECLNKIPFGLYAELERSNSLLTEINTADVDQCLESLKKLAQKVFNNDPGKLNHLGQPTSETIIEADS